MMPAAVGRPLSPLHCSICGKVACLWPPPASCCWTSAPPSVSENCFPMRARYRRLFQRVRLTARDRLLRPMQWIHTRRDFESREIGRMGKWQVVTRGSLMLKLQSQAE